MTTKRTTLKSITANNGSDSCGIAFVERKAVGVDEEIKASTFAA